MATGGGGGKGDGEGAEEGLLRPLGGTLFCGKCCAVLLLLNAEL